MIRPPPCSTLLQPRLPYPPLFLCSDGKYSACDGDRSRIQGDIGFSLGANGWLRVSAEVADQEPTNRAGLDNRPGFTELGKKYQVGIPNSHSYNTFFNW